jgi:hypothetical protein
MLIIIDKRLPDEAKQTLACYGDVLEFATSGITYESISGHPDIFFCPTPEGLVVAPNTPSEYLEILTRNHISYFFGKNPVGKAYPASARYNAVVTGKYLIHNSAITDRALSDLNPSLEMINISQGYSRCNLLSLDGIHFITSDKGIEKALLEKGLDITYVSPSGIQLPGFEHGFLGGCCGIMDKKLFISGTLQYYPEGERIRAIARKAEMEIIELFEGPLFDAGSLLFCENNF